MHSHIKNKDTTSFLLSLYQRATCIVVVGETAATVRIEIFSSYDDS